LPEEVIRMKNRFSALTVGLCITLWFAAGFFYYPKWKMSGTEATISWDVSGYYWYLPSAFIYKDLKNQEFASGIISKYNPSPDFQQAYRHTSGNYVLKYSSGLAVCMLPPFVTAHVMAPVLGFPQDGFSLPYQFALWLWGLLVGILGLLLMRNILLHWFSDNAVGLSILSIALATNLLEYSAITNAMTHNYLFTLYALLIWLSMRYYRKPAAATAIQIGLVTGMMVLIRPTEIVAVLIPLLWGLLPARKSISEKLNFLRTNALDYLFASLAFMLIVSIQGVYWKYVSGEWLVYSYGDQGFSWLQPHIEDCLFSAKAGWITYTPIALLMIAGFFKLSRKHVFFISGLVFFIVFSYITFSWNIWWYGGSLGQRAMIHTYPILMFPLSALFERAMISKWKIGMLAIITFFSIHYNFWLHHQAHRGGLLKAGEMTKPYFLAILFRYDVPEESLKLLDCKRIYRKEIKNPTTITPDNMHSLQDLICLNDSIQFSPVYTIKLPSDKGWLRASATFSTPEKEWESWKMTQMIIKYKNPHKEKFDMIRLQRLLNSGEEKAIHLDSRVDPESEHAELYFWNGSGNKTLCFTDLNVVWHPGK
jgi:hypothetical protein